MSDTLEAATDGDAISIEPDTCAEVIRRPGRVAAVRQDLTTLTADDLLAATSG